MTRESKPNWWPNRTPRIGYVKPPDRPPDRRDPNGTKCGRCRRIFAAGTLPPHGPEKRGQFAGKYLCSDCRESLSTASDPHQRPLTFD